MGLVAILAAVGAGRFKDVPSACVTWIHETERLEPGPNADILADRHAVYAKLYPALQGLFPEIAGSTSSEGTTT